MANKDAISNILDDFTFSAQDHKIFLVVVGAGGMDDFNFHHKTARFISS